MSKTTITRFDVSGTGRFPADMLRYDRCYPVDGQSAEAIFTPEYPATRGQPRTLRLYIDSGSGRKPTAARWASFGWTVTECYDEYGNPVAFAFT
jgi:hypothetical protein